MVVSWIRRGSNHLFVERVDLAAHRFVHLGRVELVGEVISNQILRHCLLLRWSSGRLFALPSRYSRSGDRKSTKRGEFFLLLALLSAGVAEPLLDLLLGLGIEVG